MNLYTKKKHYGERKSNIGIALIFTFLNCLQAAACQGVQFNDNTKFHPSLHWILVESGKQTFAIIKEPVDNVLKQTKRNVDKSNKWSIKPKSGKRNWPIATQRLVFEFVSGRFWERFFQLPYINPNEVIPNLGVPSMIS